jgi:hypothetical protein
MWYFAWILGTGIGLRLRHFERHVARAGAQRRRRPGQLGRGLLGRGVTPERKSPDRLIRAFFLVSAARRQATFVSCCD